MVALTADRHIGETGTAEMHWSPVLASLPMHELDEFVERRARLVVVAPHPDDEVLACGGLLAAHIARGGEASVIAVTDGEASHAGSETWATHELAEARRRESEAGLRLLGVPAERVTRLKMPDGSVSRYAGPLRETLDALLMRGDVVVSTWQLDGHPDHEAVGAATRAACESVGAVCLQAPVWMWHWSHPGDVRVPWQRMRGFSLGADAWQRKCGALAMHATQLTPQGRREGAVLGPLILERAARRAEHFFVPA